MKQIVLLEESEIHRLNKGKQLEISTPAGPLVIGFDRHARDGIESSPNSIGCKKCGRVFKNKHALSLHIRRKHGDLR